MGKSINIIFQWLGGLIYLIELIIALNVAKNKNAPSIIRKFYWYPLVGSIIGFLFAIKNLNLSTCRISFIINTVSLLFHYSFLTLFIYSTTARKNIFKLIALAGFCLTVWLIILDIRNSYVTSFALANTGLFFFSSYYFYKLFEGNTENPLSTNPIFYVNCGIFLGSGVIVPTSLMVKYLLVLKIPNDLINGIVSFVSIGYIIINLFFIKALLLCRKPKNIFPFHNHLHRTLFTIEFLHCIHYLSLQIEKMRIPKPCKPSFL